jgi:hypothetical protein
LWPYDVINPKVFQVAKKSKEIKITREDQIFRECCRRREGKRGENQSQTQEQALSYNGAY